MIITIQNNTLTLPNGETYRCAIGRAGVGVKRGEGDFITPIGTFPVRAGYYRADKIDAPDTAIPMCVIERDDIWIDDPDHDLYNRPTKLPCDAGHEIMWRPDDDVYDIVIPLGYNDDPVMKGKGSAIFFHIARADYTPTAGCVAVNLPDMLAILKHITVDAVFTIQSVQSI